MAAIEARDIFVQREWFLRHVIAHHQAGDHYPDPQIIGKEAGLTRAMIEAVLRDLRAIGWLAAGPYDPERIRLTPRCWNDLRRESGPQPMRERNAA